MLLRSIRLRRALGLVKVPVRSWHLRQVHLARPAAAELETAGLRRRPRYLLFSLPTRAPGWVFLASWSRSPKRLYAPLPGKWRVGEAGVRQPPQGSAARL